MHPVSFLLMHWAHLNDDACSNRHRIRRGMVSPSSIAFKALRTQRMHGKLRCGMSMKMIAARRMRVEQRTRMWRCHAANLVTQRLPQNKVGRVKKIFRAGTRGRYLTNTHTRRRRQSRPNNWRSGRKEPTENTKSHDTYIHFTTQVMQRKSEDRFIEREDSCHDPERWKVQSARMATRWRGNDVHVPF